MAARLGSGDWLMRRRSKGARSKPWRRKSGSGWWKSGKALPSMPMKSGSGSVSAGNGADSVIHFLMMDCVASPPLIAASTRR